MSDSDKDGIDGEQRLAPQARLREFASVHNFARRLGFGAEIHWFFSEARETARDGHFLASVLCAFHGIEATARWLHRELYPKTSPDLEDVSILSHRMLRELASAGFRVEALSFPGEVDFLEKIQANKPHVEFLRQRNNLAHGNAVEYFRDVSETGDRTFTPECLRDLAITLQQVCDAWTREIRRHRRSMQRAGAAVAPSSVADPGSPA